MKSDTGMLARALLAATSPREALRAWAAAVDPPAEVVALADPDSATLVALRRHASDWLPLDLPPIPLPELPRRQRSASLLGRRQDALEDLLFSIGQGELMLAPLDVGALVLARPAPPFRAAEVRTIARRADLLGGTLGALARRRGVDPTSESAREFELLFDLTRELARAADAWAAVGATALCLQRLLSPCAGAVLAVVAEDEPPAVRSWPDGPAGAEAAARASRGAAGTPAHPAPAIAASSIHWVAADPTYGRVALVLGWSGRPPADAGRVLGAAQASLSLAVERLSTQLVAEEHRFRSVVEGLPLGVALLSRNGRVRLINRAGQQLLELVRAWPPANGRLVSLGAADLQPLIAEAHSGRRGAMDVLLAAVGRTLTIRSVAAGNGSGVLLLFEDVTEARRRDEQLKQAEKLSAVGILISGVVHEIRNPLSSVLGYAQMLERSPVDVRRDSWLRTLTDEAERCQRIVGNLLAFARHNEPGRQLVSLGAIAEKALSLVAYPFRQAQVEATVLADADAPAIEADPDAMLQALINLLTNALHALEQHDGPRRVRVEIAPRGSERVVMVVADSGPGIPAQNMSKIFELFFTTKSPDKGTGLGLALVSATVRDHGGRIVVENDPGGGARFEIELPVARAGRRAEPAAERRRLPQLAGLDGLAVLVIDDEPAVASVLAEALSCAGAQVDVASDGEQALAILDERRFDAIICDVTMPRLSGPALLEQLQQRAPAVAGRVVFTSGDPGRLAALAQSGPAVLRKPFDLEHVVRVVKDISAGTGHSAG
ncbi:MAG: response regulator [Acidobacteria bacterium]|nr:response regulator [Acidobacteriota bacterium]